MEEILREVLVRVDETAKVVHNLNHALTETETGSAQAGRKALPQPPGTKYSGTERCRSRPSK